MNTLAFRLFLRCLALMLLFTSFASSINAQSQSKVLTNEDFQRKPKSNILVAKSTKTITPVNVAVKTYSSLSHFDEKNKQISQYLVTRKEVLERDILALQRELNELNKRVLQNRPVNPMAAGDAYYVDPELRAKVVNTKDQLTNLQMELQELTILLEPPVLPR